MIQVVGTANVLAMFAKAAAVGEIVEDAGPRASAEAIVDAARARVPVVTGELRDSIQVTEAGVEVGADYGVFVEYGTSDTEAQPFLRPAADEIGTKPADLLAAALFRGV